MPTNYIEWLLNKGIFLWFSLLYFQVDQNVEEDWLLELHGNDLQGMEFLISSFLTSSLHNLPIIPKSSISSLSFSESSCIFVSILIDFFHMNSPPFEATTRSDDNLWRSQGNPWKRNTLKWILLCKYFYPLSTYSWLGSSILRMTINWFADDK